MLKPSSSSTSNKRPCCNKLGQKSGQYWTPKEDEMLSDYIRNYGEGHWPKVAKNSGLHRCSSSCRFRWMTYLRPSIKHGNITPHEEDIILRHHRVHCNRWLLIAQHLSGRTDNEIKSYWNTHLSKKLIRQGIDPKTHRPLNPDSSADDHAKASSSKAKETPSGSGIPIINKENEYFQTTNVDQYQVAGPTVVHGGYANLPNSDGSGMGLGSKNGLSNEEENKINHGDHANLPNLTSGALFSDFNHCIGFCLWGCKLKNCDHCSYFVYL